MKEVNYDGKTKMLRGFPRIRKLGAINRNGEMTPFVHKGRLMRAEVVGPHGGINRNPKNTRVSCHEAVFDRHGYSGDRADTCAL